MALLSDTLTERELAVELKRSPGTLTRWRRERKGPPVLRVQGRVLYSRSEVEIWLEQQRQDFEQPQPAAKPRTTPTVLIARYVP